MPISLNRALHVRVADRLRAALARHVPSGLPHIAGLSETDQRELYDLGGGRLAVIALRVDPPFVREVVAVVQDAIRRTDLFGGVSDETLLVLAPGLTPGDGTILLDRLRSLLGDFPVRLGVAYHSRASGSTCNPRALVAEAEALVA